MKAETIIKHIICDFLEVAKTKTFVFADLTHLETEMHAKHTLLFMEEKHTRKATQPVHSLAHSYKIMLLWMVLFPYLYICLQETKSTSGPHVKQ